MHALAERMKNMGRDAGLGVAAFVIVAILTQVGIAFVFAAAWMGLSGLMGPTAAFLVLAVIALLPIVGAMVWLAASKKTPERIAAEAQVKPGLDALPARAELLVRKHPWAAIGVSAGMGLLLARNPRTLAALARAFAAPARSSWF